ncbi:hypothetical protein LCGC14_1959130 [marine sediment metagenome]|uniref:ATP-dependent DNA ligase family profile domain-containing protein n=1 Tax=marine sediment metagenome TaxID=412755 RepID=A0A0F9HTG8_9ZZZZ
MYYTLLKSHLTSGELLPFQELMHRRRKYKIEKAVSEYPITVNFFDIMYADGKSWLDVEYEKRREILEKIVIENDFAKLVPMTIIQNENEIEEFLENSINAGCEGLMLKMLNAPYKAGSRGSNWLKLKREYRNELGDSLDLVVIGAFFGRGRRTGRYGTLLLAAYDDGTDSFPSICKVGTGFTDEDLDQLYQLLQSKVTLKKNPRINSEMEADVWFEPELVLEIVASEITLSPIHKTAMDVVRKNSGLALRFPKFTGKIRLEKGSQTIMLNPNEETWKKTYTKSEIKAIKFKDGFDKTRAHPLWVLENEVTKIMSEKEQKIIFGPKVILLEPYERPHVMSIAGGTPKNTKRLKIWKIKLGPNFSTDIVEVRTKDNAVLSIRLRYQWKFIIYDDHEKIYGTNDFVGLMTEMMASIIRDKAAKHDFEELHSKASEIIKKAIFGESEYYEFENGLRVFGIDIKEIVPKDEEIADRMNEAIKSNMEIYVNKMKQNAKIEAEKTKIKGQKIIEEERKELIKLEHENYTEEELIKTKVEAEQIKIKAKAESEAISLKAKAEIKAIEDEMNILKDANENYIKIKQLKKLSNIKKIVIVPTGSKLFLPLDKFLEE